MLQEGAELGAVLGLVAVVLGIDLLVRYLFAVLLFQDLVQNHLLQDLLTIAGGLHTGIVFALGNLSPAGCGYRLISAGSQWQHQGRPRDYRN